MSYVRAMIRRYRQPPSAMGTIKPRPCKNLFYVCTVLFLFSLLSCVCCLPFVSAFGLWTPFVFSVHVRTSKYGYTIRGMLAQSSLSFFFLWSLPFSAIIFFPCSSWLEQTTRYHQLYTGVLSIVPRQYHRPGRYPMARLDHVARSKTPPSSRDRTTCRALKKSGQNK